MTSRDPDQSEPSADAVYAAFMQRLSDGESVDIDELCARYPQIAPQLCDLYSHQETVPRLQRPENSAADSPHLETALGGSGGGAPRYGMLERVAQGGMGVVYKVWDGILHRELAMKLIRGKISRQGKQSGGTVVSPEALARFKREAEITARLDHPGIVPIHDMGTDEQGRVFFTMRLVKGQRLDVVFDLARKQLDRWSQTRVLDVIVKICETLAFAHSRGVIHRDLKPANIMVGRFGETYVMDWGLAKLIREPNPEDPPTVVKDDHDADAPEASNPEELPGEQPGETRAGTVLGTAPYMPPEQAAGRIGDLDERSDVYSVGAILYELLTGSRPFAVPGKSTDPRDVVPAVLLGPPAPIPSLNPSVPAELSAICDKAMGRRKDDRYQTMLAMAEDLRAYLENRVVRAYQSGAVAELRKWVLRNRGTALASALGLAIAFCGLLAVVNVQSRANAVLSQANLDIQMANVRIQKETELKDKALDEQTKARKIADTERRRAEGLFLARAAADVVATNPGQALLLALESDERQPGFEANSALLAALPYHLEKRVLAGHRAPLRMADVSPDGTRVATASDDHTAILWDADAGALRAWLIGHRDFVHAVRYSHDGRLVATASYDHTAALWNARTGERLHVLAGHTSVVWNVAFSPDDRRLATASLDGTARIWDVDTGEQLSLIAGHSAEILQVAFSRDGGQLLTGSADQSARLWDAASGAERACLTGHKGGVNVAIFSPDGARLVTAAAAHWIDRDSAGKQRDHPTADKTARIWDRETGALQVVLEHDSAVHSAAFSGDGRRVATGAADGIVRIWIADSGALEHKFEIGDGAVHAVAFSPDGHLVAAGCERGSARVWEAKTGIETARLLGHSDAVRTVAFLSPNALVTASHDRTARTWNALSAGTITSLVPGDYRDARVEVSSDALRLIVHPLPSGSVGLYSFPEGKSLAVLKHDRPVDSVRFSPDGEFVGTRTDAGVVRVYQATSGSLHMTLDGTGRAQGYQFGADKRLVVVSRSEGIVTTWDLGQRLLQHRLMFPQAKVLEVSPDGRRLLTWAEGEDEAGLWDLTAGTRIAQLPAVVRSARDFPLSQFSGDGKTLITWSLEHPAPRLWKGETGRLIAPLDLDGTKGPTVVFSPEGRSVAGGSADAAPRIWETENGRLRTIFSGHEPSALRIAVGPNAERVVTSSETKFSRLWNGQTGEAIGMLGDRDDAVQEAWFSRDGKLLLTLNTSRDKVVVWEALNGERLALARSGGSPFTMARLSPDGRWFVTGFKDGSARIWPVSPAKFSRALVQRELTPDERELFQLGTDDERAAHRRAWNERSMTDLLSLAGKAGTKSADQAREVQIVAQREIRGIVESQGPGSTKPEFRETLIRAEEVIRKGGGLSSPVAFVLATVFGQHDDVPRAERLLRSVVDRGDLDEPAVWNSWAALSLGKARRTPRQILADFPKSRSRAAEDLKWLLERQVVGDAIRIRAGGDELVTAGGVVWRHDCFFGGGYRFGESFGKPQPSSEEIHNTSDDRLYQTERWFDRDRPKEERGYQIPLAPGRYRVALHFAEISFRPPESRIMDVLAEEEVVIAAYDTLHAGFATAERREFEVRVDDGILDLEFRSVRQNPKVSAIEIFRLAE